MNQTTDNKPTNKPASNPASISCNDLALLKQMRNVSGLTAEYLMTFLDRFSSKSEQLLIYSICCNFDRLKHTIELHLLEHGVHLSGVPYDAKAFSNITYVDVNLPDSIQKFLDEKQPVTVEDKLFVN